MSFPQRIQEIMQQKRLSYQQFADTIGFAKSTVHNWIEGNSAPTLRAIGKICKAFDVSADWLLGLDSQMEDSKHTKIKKVRQLLKDIDEKDYWLYLGIETCEVEEVIPTDTEFIWVVTTTLDNEIPSGIAYESVKHNLKRGIKYTYIIPENEPKCVNNIDILLNQVFQDYPDSLKFIQVPGLQNYLFYSNAVIFNPLGINSCETMVFVQLITDATFWLKLNKKDTSEYVGKVKILMKKSQG